MGQRTNSGEYLSELTFGAEAERRYSAPYLLMHRGDLHAALAAAVPPEHIVFNKKLVGLDRKGAGVDIWADAVVGADGAHSLVRETPFGPEKLVFTGRVAHCTVFPAGLLGNFVVDGCAKWCHAWQTPLVRPHLRAAS